MSNPITVSICVEAVGAIITNKKVNPKSKIKYIAVSSIYYRGSKSTKNRSYLIILLTPIIISVQNMALELNS